MTKEVGSMKSNCAYPANPPTKIPTKRGIFEATSSELNNRKSPRIYRDGSGVQLLKYLSDNATYNDVHEASLSAARRKSYTRKY